MIPPATPFLVLCPLIFTKRQIVWHARVSTRGPILDPVNKHLASRIICVSHAVKNRFEPWSSSKCVVIYNGVDSLKFSPQSAPGGLKQEVNIPNDSLLVSTIMQVIPQKGAEEFVKAAVSLCEKVENVSFVVVGVWTDGAFIEKLRGIADSFRDRIHFLGYRRNIWDILNDSDVFVLPTWPYMEGLPRVVIEAMACGVPVVGTDVEGTNEAVVQDETGLLVPPKDAASLANAIMKLIDEPQLRTRFGGKRPPEGGTGFRHRKTREQSREALQGASASRLAARSISQTQVVLLGISGPDRHRPKAAAIFLP